VLLVAVYVVHLRQVLRVRQERQRDHAVDQDGLGEALEGHVEIGPAGLLVDLDLDERVTPGRIHNAVFVSLVGAQDRAVFVRDQVFCPDRQHDPFIF